MHLTSRTRHALCVLALCCFTGAAAGAEIRELRIDPRGDVVEMVGGPAEEPTDEISDAERTAIRKSIEANRERLIREGKLSRLHAKTLTNFAWPLRFAAGRTDFDYHGISNFVDEDPAYPNHVLDYTCGNRSYDLASGYNHRGTDIFTWPFAWNKMDDEDVVIVAGAPGTIVLKSDGNFDRSCSIGGGTWNAVYVQHADGSVAWYGHMKSGSTTVKAVGDTVVAGEYLGVVGSSGSSTGPHLHLEIYDASNALVDPWLGACNSMSKQVTWASQRAYRDTSVNALTVGTAAPNLGSCPSPETSHATEYLAPGGSAYFTVYLRDQVAGIPVTIRILRPDGSVFYGPADSGNGTYNASWWYWSWANFSTTTGTWTFEARIGDATFTKTFHVGGSPPFGPAAAIEVVSGSGQTAAPGSAFANPLKVRVTDSLARNVKGAKVVFTVPGSGATAVLESRTALTDESGVATVSAIANGISGSYTVIAAPEGVERSVNLSLQNISAANPARLFGISTRTQVLSGDNVMIVGFIIGGSAPKSVIVRARGPSLGIAGLLADPVLTLVPASGPPVTNDNWGLAPNAAQISTSGFAPSNPLEAAILQTLNPGAYTAIVSGFNNGTGVGIVEVYEIDGPSIPLVGISTRAQVQSGDNVMIAGVIIQGDSPQTVVVRARGPSLGVAGALQNPTLTLVPASGTPITNDDWGSASNAAQISASGFAPSDPRESAILVTLSPGAYTAIVSGVDGTTGVAIVEVYRQ